MPMQRSGAIEMGTEDVAPAREHLAADTGRVHGCETFVYRLHQFGEERPDLRAVVEMDSALAIRPVLQRQPELFRARLQRLEQMRWNIMGVNVDRHRLACSTKIFLE